MSDEIDAALKPGSDFWKWFDEMHAAEQAKMGARVEAVEEMRRGVLLALGKQAPEVAALVKAARTAHERLVYELRGSGSVDSHDAARQLREALKPFEEP